VWRLKADNAAVFAVLAPTYSTAMAIFRGNRSDSGALYKDKHGKTLILFVIFRSLSLPLPS